MEIPLIQPEWPAAKSIHAFTTTRLGGEGLPPFDSLNLGSHVGDSPNTVLKNRQKLKTQLNLPGEPLWLEQVHGINVADATLWQPGCEADASYCDQPHRVCSILTADCLPVLFCNQQGTQVAAAHAGWRGLLNGVLENTVAHFKGDPSDILAWLGPAIGPQQFEVGKEVFEAFTRSSPEATSAFQQTDPEHYLADIYQLARQQLGHLGIKKVYGGTHCTVTESETFFSYRRDGQTGRMASLIWIDNK